MRSPSRGSECLHAAVDVKRCDASGHVQLRSALGVTAPRTRTTCAQGDAVGLIPENPTNAQHEAPRTCERRALMGQGAASRCPGNA